MLKRFEHGGNIYQENSIWIDFSANINPLGMSPLVRQALIDHIDDIVHYPDPEGRELKKALHQHYGIPYDRIVLGNGAAELFYLYMHTFRPRRVVLPVPSFSEYEKAALAVGAEIGYFYLHPNEQFTIHWEQLRRSVMGADCIILGNPNNPTGNLICAAELTDFVAYCHRIGTAVLIDESFLDFRIDEAQYTCKNLPAYYDNVFIIRSLTKFFAIPGLRLGFAVVPLCKKTALESNKDVWNTNILAQLAGIAALKDKKYQRNTIEYIEKTKNILYNSLKSIHKLRIFMPSVNFILFKNISKKVSTKELVFILRKEKILIRECNNYPGLDDSFVRIAVRKQEDNEKLVNAIKKAFCNV